LAIYIKGGNGHEEIFIFANLGWSVAIDIPDYNCLFDKVLH
jgi:hypothetical protein